MRASFVLHVVFFACLCLASLAEPPAKQKVSSCPSPFATAATIRADGTAEDPDDCRLHYTGRPGSASERSFFAVKPDGLQRGLVGELTSRFEKKGWKLVGLKLVDPSRELVERHYAEHAGKDFFEKLLDYMCSGPVVAMVWEGVGVIAGGRKMLGATNPLDAQPGTIRGDLCTNSGRNLVHASDGPESARREIELWFAPDETVQWSRATDPWVSRNL